MIFKTAIILLICNSVFCAPTEPETGLLKSQPNNNNKGIIGGLLGCRRSQYSCKSNSLLQSVCLGLDQLCNGVKDCPDGEDEANSLCMPKELIEQLKKQSNDGIQNDFAGTGFMFSVGNIVVSGGSRVKLFNQNSDNIADPNSTQKIISNGGQQN